MIKVYGVHGSPFVRKVYVALDFKGIEYKTVPQMPFARDAEYQKINPLGKVPTLEHDDLILCDSKVICQYLEDIHPAPPLYPNDAVSRARARWYEELGGNQLSELGAGIFFQRFMRPLAFKQDPDEELIDKIVNKKLPPLLDYLENEVPGDGFLFGEFMMADLSLVSPFINASYAGFEVDAARWPRFAAFIGRVKAQPQVAAVLGQEAQALGIGQDG
jgi:glutathione S-transferase